LPTSALKTCGRKNIGVTKGRPHMPSNEQIESVEQEFFATVPGAAAYDTDETRDRLYSYILGAFKESVLSVAAWEIAFKDLLGKRQVKKIPGYVPPVTDEQRRMIEVPSYIARERYKTDPEFKAAWDAVAAEEEEFKKNPWIRLTAAQYMAMDPNHAAQLWVDNEQFQQAVQRLIDRGEI
jgi:hypothetical protein